MTSASTGSTDQQAMPDGFGTVTPHLIVRGADAAIRFYIKALGAEEIARQPGPDGRSILHATLRIGDSMIMLNDEFPEWGCLGPESLGGSSVTIHLYVDDVDRWFQRAIKAGGIETMPVAAMFWGDRYGKFRDPFGHEWSIATRSESLNPDQIQARAEAYFAATVPPQ